jgi:hypothetical protein|tara:strand:- start:800 stop:982 length:183 start_codon:yes stop_codon:yes gene_type:complete
MLRSARAAEPSQVARAPYFDVWNCANVAGEQKRIRVHRGVIRESWVEALQVVIVLRSLVY